MIIFIDQLRAELVFISGPITPALYSGQELFGSGPTLQELQKPGLEVLSGSPSEGKDQSHSQSLLQTSLLEQDGKGNDCD